MDYVAEARSLVDSLNAILLQLSDDIVRRRDELVVVEKRLSEKAQAIVDAGKNLDDIRAEAVQEKFRLKTEEVALENQIGIAKKQRDELTDTNARLKIDNVRLGDENKKFRAYEAQAMKVLDAKDESLKARSKEIAETEILLANRASFLPKKE